MTKKILIVLFLTVAATLLFLSGCGSPSPASSGGGGGGGAAYYVNAFTGLDTNAGTQAAPFKTITKALAMASTGATTNIFVAPGTYNAANGEVFPLKVASSGINLIGVGTPPTITGGAAYAAAAGELGGSNFPHAVAFVPGVTATMTNFSVNGSQETICIDGATVTLSNTTLSGSTDIALWVVNGAKATLTSNTINNGNWSILVADGTTSVKARGNIITTPNSNSVVVGYMAAFPAGVDLGTAADPGNNVIRGSGTGVGLLVQVASAAAVPASGNVWKPGVQGADTSGHYPVGYFVAASGAAMVGGNNYGNANAAPIQMYSLPGSITTATKASY